MSQDVIVLDNLSFKYPGAKDFALRDLNIRVRQGEFLGVTGPTGAGKSTLCLALNGVVPHFYGGEFYGSVHVAGLDTMAHPTYELARHIGMVFQDPEMQLTAPTVTGEIAFGLENLSTPVDVMRERIPAALEVVRLQGTQARHPHQLSGGQKQRLAIAAALAMQPDVLVLDEPTSQLDPVGTDEVFSVIRELNRSRGMTIILVSHASEELAEYADRVLLLAGGSVVDEGSPRQFFQNLDLLRQHDVRPPEVTTALRHLPTVNGDLPVTLSEAVTCFQGPQPRAAVLPPPSNGVAKPAPVTGDVLLRASNLGYTYEDGTVALNSLDLEIRRGEYVAIVGQNGAGKSTLVRQFLHLLTPTKGEVRAFDRNVNDYDVSSLAQRIGYISQNPDNQIFCDTVEREVGFALDKLGFAPKEVRERVAWALDEMRLSWAAAEHPLTLSKGDRSRIVIAAILAMRPEVLIFDEPTTGQDYRGARAILDLTRELHAAGRTIIVITHHLYLLPGYAERLVVMGRGRILLDAPLREAFYETATLRETFITPPQVIQLAEAIQSPGAKRLRPITPDELAAAITFN